MHLLPYLSILLTASAVYLPLQPRLDPCVQDMMDTEMVRFDGITADGTAGIGAEFESPLFYFVHQGCNAKDTNAAKGEVVAKRTGPNWFLSADTGVGQGKLNAEYILDGRNIKVGSGDGAKAGKAVADDLIGWHPWTGDKPSTVDISNNKCNPWTIDAPTKNTDPKDVEWAPQITTPMPLEAVYSLMKEQQADPDLSHRNILDGFPKEDETLVVVTQEYFQSNTNGIDRSKVTDDVLGFCSLVLSYAKAAIIKLGRDQSPKQFQTFMPRTEFNTIFKQVESKIPGDLFGLFNSLACYKTKDGKVVVDTEYCKGPLSKPVPNNKFGALSYTNSVPRPPVTVNIKSWIQGIGKGSPSPDELTKFDQSIDSSIGGLGDRMEKMYKSERSVPLFEFRDLNEIHTSGIENFMTKVDSTIQTLHKDFANALKKGKRASCTMPGTPIQSSPTSPNPVVVAPVDPPSTPSCVTDLKSHVKDSHEVKLMKAAKYFCDKYASDTNAKGPINIAQTIIAETRAEGRAVVDVAYDYLPKMGNRDDVYDITLTSVTNCTTSGGFNLATPVAKNQCLDILYNSWKHCKYNQGRGGAITAGCLVYSVKTKY